jgi:hypothetical protein
MMPNYAPITYKDPAANKLTRFDIELGEALAKELGVGIEWQEIAFAQMILRYRRGIVTRTRVGGKIPGCSPVSYVRHSSHRRSSGTPIGCISGSR